MLRLNVTHFKLYAARATEKTRFIAAVDARKPFWANGHGCAASGRSLALGRGCPLTRPQSNSLLSIVNCSSPRASDPHAQCPYQRVCHLFPLLVHFRVLERPPGVAEGQAEGQVADRFLVRAPWGSKQSTNTASSSRGSLSPARWSSTWPTLSSGPAMTVMSRRTGG